MKMLEARDKILKFNQNYEFMKIPFIIYAECFLEKISSCDNNPTKLFTSKTNKHTPCRYSLFTHFI